MQQKNLMTEFGEMIAIANHHYLYLLEFAECKKLDQKIKQLAQKTKSSITEGSNKIIYLIQKELESYYEGTLTTFQTPIHFLGTPFQQSVWNSLIKIPFGKTISYAELANSIRKPTAYRAVANANGCNQLAIIVPCHRVINSNGNLGGYGGGIAHKKRLLVHESRHSG